MATLTPLGPGLLQNQALGAGDSVPGLQAHDVSVAMETPASISTCCSCRRPPGREGLAGWREAEQRRTLPACGPAPERGPREGGVPVVEGTLQLSIRPVARSPDMLLCCSLRDALV